MIYLQKHFSPLEDTLSSHSSIFVLKNIQKIDFSELIVRKDPYRSHIICLIQDQKVIDNVFLIYKIFFIDCKTIKYRKLDGTFQCRITYERNIAITSSFKFFRYDHRYTPPFVHFGDFTYDKNALQSKLYATKMLRSGTAASLQILRRF